MNTKSLIAAVLALTLFVMVGPAYSADARGAANVQLVKTFLKEVRVAAASGEPAKLRAVVERFMSEDYIQHAVGFPPGREGFIQMMSKMRPPGPPSAGGPPSGPMPKPKDLYFVGDGDYVVWVSEAPFQDPSRAADHPKLLFNMLRIVDGKFREHWDSD